MTNYIISLKEPIQKMEYLQSQGINTTWIEGINGKEVDKNYVKNHFVNFYSNFGPSGSIGCSLSHLKTWKTFLESGKDYCIIFEDDVVLKKKFYKTF